MRTHTGCEQTKPRNETRWGVPALGPGPFHDAYEAKGLNLKLYVTLSHVRAHARTSGNEAADQLAKEVAQDGTVSNDAMRALTIASTAHRRVRGESGQTSWQPPHQPHQPPHHAHQHTGTGAPGRGFGDG